MEDAMYRYKASGATSPHIELTSDASKDVVAATTAGFAVEVGGPTRLLVKLQIPPPAIGEVMIGPEAFVCRYRRASLWGRAQCVQHFFSAALFAHCEFGSIWVVLPATRVILLWQPPNRLSNFVFSQPSCRLSSFRTSAPFLTGRPFFSLGNLRADSSVFVLLTTFLQIV
jgi:hypothetical protein